MERQFIVVELRKNKNFKGVIKCYEKVEKKCVHIFTFDCVIGRRGIVSYEEKTEGDMATPSGKYGLGFVFGYGEKPNTKMNYIRLTENHKWIDDPEHPLYDRLIIDATDAKSYEIMRRDDNQYKLGIVINFNTDPVIKNKGSAIFIHIWKDGETPTKGCIALDENSIKSLIEWLDPDKNPLIIIKKT